MEFIVEDGNALPNASSYCTVQYATDYITTFARDNDTWQELSNEDKELFLIRATRYVDNMMRWTSVLKKSDQSLNWPRQDFYDINGRLVSSKFVPTDIKDAVALVASEDSKGVDLHEQRRYLQSEKFGDTSDTYAIPLRVGGSDDVRSLVNGLAYLGYGASRTTFVTLWRS